MCLFFTGVGYKTASWETNLGAGICMDGNYGERKTNSWIEISVCMDYCVGCGWPLMSEEHRKEESEGDWQREIETCNETEAKKEKVLGGCYQLQSALLKPAQCMQYKPANKYASRISEDRSSLLLFSAVQLVIHSLLCLLSCNTCWRYCNASDKMEKGYIVLSVQKGCVK